MIKSGDKSPGRRVGEVGMLQLASLAAVGVIGGVLLGGATLDHGAGRAGAASTSYAALSGNPDALAVERFAQDPCYDCANGYGVAERMRAARREDSLRPVAAVELDYAPPPTPEPADDYHYGGRFPDASPDPVAADRPSMVIRQVADSKLVTLSTRPRDDDTETAPAVF